MIYTIPKINRNLDLGYHGLRMSNQKRGAVVLLLAMAPDVSPGDMMVSTDKTTLGIDSAPAKESCGSSNDFEATKGFHHHLLKY